MTSPVLQRWLPGWVAAQSLARNGAPLRLLNAPPRPTDDLPLPGREITGPVIDSIASVAQLRNVALGAEVDEALFAHMATTAGRRTGV